MRFYGALGNHDEPETRNYPAFNMDGERYYTFAQQNVRFVVLDTNILDPQAAGMGRNDAARHRPSRGRSSTSTIRCIPNGETSRIGRRAAGTIMEPMLVAYGVSGRVLGARPRLRASHAAERDHLLRDRIERQAVARAT